MLPRRSFELEDVLGSGSDEDDLLVDEACNLVPAWFVGLGTGRMAGCGLAARALPWLLDDVVLMLAVCLAF